MPKSNPHSPRTKRELRDRILSYGFSGDLRSLSPQPENVRIKAAGATIIGLDFPDTGHFDLVIRKPREAKQEAPAAVQRGSRIIAASEPAPQGNITKLAHRQRRKARA